MSARSTFQSTTNRLILSSVAVPNFPEIVLGHIRDSNESFWKGSDRSLCLLACIGPRTQRLFFDDTSVPTVLRMQKVHTTRPDRRGPAPS
jgi:hypothetical protein